ncbi:hypothetical protein R3W88_033166 [Solanum pinnatisectum]|uniref:UDP-galactose transporter n=1 Tax=Solanum pinnatisectum TaxID=50273 RepID=A0AAV9K1V6_9SOLN|nr:hypothetical protein R3W88_033166 [Solanum pinnatisectum]
MASISIAASMRCSTEKIMRVPYGPNKDYFIYSLFLVFCNRITTSAVSAGVLLASKKALDPVAPLHKYCIVSVSNILTTTCQSEASSQIVSFPVQTLAKFKSNLFHLLFCLFASRSYALSHLQCFVYKSNTIEYASQFDTHLTFPFVFMQIWGTIIMQKKYKGQDYFVAFLVTLGCSLFILYPPYSRERESTIWGVSLMMGYLGFDGFTSTFQDKLFKGYDMEIHTQIFYTTVCSLFFCMIMQGNLLMAIDFVSRHHDCFFDIALLSTVSSNSLVNSSFRDTIRTFGALTFPENGQCIDSIKTSSIAIGLSTPKKKNYCRTINQVF